MGSILSRYSLFKKKYMDISKKEEIAGIYKFLANCFYYPEEKQISLIKGHDLKDHQKYQSLINFLEDIDCLKVDYSKLFVGPFKVLAPPYGSVYLDEGKAVYGKSTIDIANMYSEESLKVDLKEPADHIAIELEFMYYLILKELEEIEKEKIDKSIEYLNKQKSIINNHLSIWVPKFTDEISNHANTEFYKQLSLLLNDLIKSEHLRLK
jgi:TorA maturation chaperone TorD